MAAVKPKTRVESFTAKAKRARLEAAEKRRATFAERRKVADAAKRKEAAAKKAKAEKERARKKKIAALKAKLEKASKPLPAVERRGGRREGSGRKALPLHVLKARNSRAPRVLQAKKEGREEEFKQPVLTKKADAEDKDYAAIAKQYAKDVRDGKIVACKWVRLACVRHLEELDKQHTKDFPYYFSAEQANKFCKQIEKYPHIKGKWAAKKEFVKLEPWQCFCLAVPFGWMRLNHKRRFRRIYWCVPRKNAKSTAAAGIGLNMLTIDGEHGAEVYAGATSEKQAWEVFGPARLMLEKSPGLRKEFGIEVMARSITRAEDNSRFQPIIGKPGDGASPSCSIHDEYHEHDVSDQVDTMETGMGSREQPMLVIITTAGTNLASPCYDMQKAAEKVLEGVLQDDELFVIVYTIDLPDPNGKTEEEKKGDDWADPAALRKANPNIGVSVDEDFLLAQQRNAIQNPSHQNRFKTKHLNIWCAASVAGINMHQWRLCGDAGMSIEDFVGNRCWGSLDLASKTDICAFAQVFMRIIKGQKHYYAFSRHYLPEQTIEERGPNQMSYRRWVIQQRLITTPGAEIDFETVCDDVKAYKDKFQFEEIVYDPWRATQLAQDLRKDGAVMVEIGQTPKNMGAAFDEFTSAIKGGRFHHDGDPVLEWMASNVVARSVMKGLTVPGKEKKDAKIDGIVAIVMAIARAMMSEDSGGMMDWLTKPVVVSA